MKQIKKEHLKEKSNLHLRNKHRERYDFKSLTNTCIELKLFVEINNFGDETINFSNPEAVKMLNKALLKHFYEINFWDIPAGYLCPPIPGRADYIHYIADLLTNNTSSINPVNNKITCLDIGVGANCVYPIIARKEYNWNVIGADIDLIALQSAQNIVIANDVLKNKVTLRLQDNKNCIFKNIVFDTDRIDITICNPPFHASANDAKLSANRKVNNLNNKKVSKVVLNFGGQNNELWCIGGEERFIENMIRESKLFSNQILWFSSLVSKNTTLKPAIKLLENIGAIEIKTISMSQGNKVSRILAWTFQDPNQQKQWRLNNW